MATKRTLLKDFSGGQGGGLASYTTYPADHDSNYEDIETTLFELVDEVAAARLADTSIPTDILLADEAVTNTAGRFAPWEVQVTYTTTTITVTSGRCYANGQRIDVTGTTFPYTSNGTWYIATDQSGLLAISTTPNNSFFDIADMTAAAGVWSAVAADNLAFNQLTPLNTGNTANRIYERVTGNSGATGKQNPAIRTVDKDGNLGDAGFEYLDEDEFSWYSQRATAHGSGAAVEAAQFRKYGQLLLMEQARVIATGTGVAAGVSNAFTALNLDTADRREPATYITNPFFTPTGNTLTVPTGGEYDGTYLVTGYVHFPTGSTTGPYNADILAGGTVVARGGISKPGAAVDGTISLSGMVDLTASDTIQIRAGTGAVSAENVNCRLSVMLIGG